MRRSSAIGKSVRPLADEPAVEPLPDHLPEGFAADGEELCAVIIDGTHPFRRIAPACREPTANSTSLVDHQRLPAPGPQFVGGGEAGHPGANDQVIVTFLSSAHDLSTLLICRSIRRKEYPQLRPSAVAVHGPSQQSQRSPGGEEGQPRRLPAARPPALRLHPREAIIE